MNYISKYEYKYFLTCGDSICDLSSLHHASHVHHVTIYHQGSHTSDNAIPVVNAST